jgi:RNA polymerase sigma-70 factor (ECF subfamily)
MGRAVVTVTVAASGPAGILSLAAGHVRFRFALDAEAFAEHVAALAASMAPGTPPEEHARRLSLDDLYLAAACARGEEAAWEECLARHGAFIRDFARRFLREPAASDVADHVIADLWERRKMARYQGRSTLRTWLGSIVAHAALNAMKTGRRTLPLEGDEDGAHRSAARGAPETGSGPERSLLEELVKEAMEGLPAEGKLLLLLYYEQGLTLDEMAAVLGGSKAALSRKLQRTRDELRASIDSLSRRRAGSSAEWLRAGIDLGHLELDLGRLLGGAQVEREPGGAV